VADQPEPWLRGPVSGVPLLLQPAAHALVMSGEDVERSVAGLSREQVWAAPGGIAPVGFHLVHLSGSTDRLLTYARGEPLSDAQREALDLERRIAHVRPPLEQLLADWKRTIARALEQLSSTSESMLAQPRSVGRAQLPSNVLGLLFHAAEHASRHTGQLVTTARLVRAESMP
jgi:uncharacterized damage-inducible protein DinB